MAKCSSQLILDCLGAQIHGKPFTFEGVAIDSRKVEPGNLFIAIKGERADGHDFIDAAKARGAVGCLVQRQIESELPQIVVDDVLLAFGKIAWTYWQKNAVTTVGITGSNGKTTTKNLLGHVLQGQFPCLVTQGNYNNHIGVPLTLLSHKAQSHAVIEMGANHQGEIDYLSSLVCPQIAIITNIGPAHLEGFGGIDGVYRGKTELFKHLASGGVGLFNADTHGIDALTETTFREKILTFGQNKKADYRIVDLAATEAGTASFKIRCFEKDFAIKLNILGLHNAWNAASVFAACIELGMDADWIIERLEQYRGLPGRLQLLAGLNDSSIINDSYNANLGSFAAAIDLLNTLKGEKIIVMGEMGELGDSEVEHHAAVGEKAKAAGVTRLFTIGEKTLPAVQAFGLGAQVFRDHEELAKALKGLLSEASIVLVKGSRSAQMEKVLPTIILEKAQKEKK